MISSNTIEYEFSFCHRNPIFRLQNEMVHFVTFPLSNRVFYFFLKLTFSFLGMSKPVITNHNFLAVYFDRRHKDLKLLLNLLAETSGLPESFRILTLFDKKFQSLWKPQNLRFEEYETVLPNRTVKSRSIIVRWNDAPIGHFLTNYNAALAFEYTIGNN